jgi:hypothetical protein
MNMATTCLVHEIRTEFKELPQSHIFEQWMADEDIKESDLSEAAKELSEQCADVQESHD